MKVQRQILRAALIAAVLTAAGTAVQLHAQTVPVTGDFTNAAVAEVRNELGQVVLSGQFQRVDEDDDDVERKAVLATAGGDADARGEAEIEFTRNAPVEQEVEFSVRNLPPNVAFTFAIDGTAVGVATTDARGHAEFEISVRLPGAAAAQ
jgi:hypothetical protein